MHIRLELPPILIASQLWCQLDYNNMNPSLDNAMASVRSTYGSCTNTDASLERVSCRKVMSINDLISA